MPTIVTDMNNEKVEENNNEKKIKALENTINGTMLLGRQFVGAASSAACAMDFELGAFSRVSWCASAT